MAATAQAPEPEGAAFEGWAIVELMGHRRLGANVSERSIAGVVFLRLDIPWRDPDKAIRTTQFYRPDVVYCLTPCTEETARLIASSSEPATAPARYSLPEATVRQDDEDDFDDQQELAE